MRGQMMNQSYVGFEEFCESLDKKEHVELAAHLSEKANEAMREEPLENETVN